MFRWLTLFPREYTLTSRLKAPGGARPRNLFDLHDARHFVARLSADPRCRSELHAIAYDRFVPNPNRTHRDLVERLAHEIASGWILVFDGMLERRRRQCRYRPLEAPPEEVASARPPASIKHYFALMVVEDQSDKPIANVEVEVTLADGATRPCTTAADGCAEVKPVTPGGHSISCPIGDVMLARTLEFVSMGGSPSRPKTAGAGKKVPGKTTRRDAAANGHGAALSITGVKAHKVKSGDTLAKIASAHHRTESELAFFNWGVRSPAQIQQRLRDEVGCRKRDEEGRYVLDGADEPGIIYVPLKWCQQGLAADQCHMVRVRPVARKLPDLRFHYQIDPHDARAKNDVLTLETENGSWSHEVPVGELAEVDQHWVEVVFPEPPAGMRFNLIMDPKDGEQKHYIFRGIGHGELQDALAEQDVDDEA